MTVVGNTGGIAYISFFSFKKWQKMGGIYVVVYLYFL